MKKQKVALLLALAITLPSAAATAQTRADGVKAARAGSTASSGVEPLRVINGEMRGRKITGRFRKGRRPVEFSFIITRADVVNDRLQLGGDFALNGSSRRRNDEVTATIAGAMTKIDNPWPQASDQPRQVDRKSKAAEQAQGREAKSPEVSGQLGQLSQATQDTARKTPSPPGERNEQTQSLYAQAEAGNGCGVIFLKLTLPARLRAEVGAGREPLQLGVVTALFDNRTGEEINRQICRIIRARENRSAASDMSASVQQLNRLLASSQ
jgi:hypothetical protein